jgi:hypothetical protein
MIKALCVVAVVIILVARVHHPGTPPTETSMLLTETDGVEVWRDGGLVYVRSDARLMAPAFGEERLDGHLHLYVLHDQPDSSPAGYLAFLLWREGRWIDVRVPIRSTSAPDIAMKELLKAVRPMTPEDIDRIAATMKYRVN